MLRVNNPRVSCSQKDSTMQMERLRLDHPWAVTSNLEKVVQKHSQFKLISLIQIVIAFTLGDKQLSNIPWEQEVEEKER